MELNELPGSELILLGLEDLCQGRNNTIGALLIAIASVRLTEAGLDEGASSIRARTVLVCPPSKRTR